MYRGMLIWYSGVILNRFFSGKVSVMECCVRRNNDKYRGRTWVPAGVEGQMWKLIHTGTPLAVDQPASLSSLTLSTHVITALAEVTATSCLPYADTFPPNYGKNSDARRIWMPSRRTRKHPNYRYICQRVGLKFMIDFSFPWPVTSKLVQHIFGSPFMMQLSKQPTKIAQGY